MARQIAFPIWVAAAAFVAAASPLAAQDARPYQLTFDLGFVSVSGNTRVTSFNLGEQFGYKTGAWTFAQTAKAVYGSTDGTPTAEMYEAGVRGDRLFAMRFSAFGLATWYRNTFAGVARRWSVGAGLSFRAVQTPRDTVRLEGALSSNHDRSVAGVTNTFAGTRAAAIYRHAFNGKAVFSQFLELLSNLKNSDDQRVNSETALSAPISRRIALKASYVIRFDNQPEPGFQDTDRIFTTGVQLVF